jgi:hypothetical protein
MVAASDGDGRRDIGGGARKREVNGEAGCCSASSRGTHTRETERGDLVRDLGALP